MARTSARPPETGAAAESLMEDPTPMLPEGTADNPEVIAASAAQVAQVANISRIDKMREHFKSQPRVRVKVHNDGPVRVQVNGYSFLIQPGKPVEVPEQIAEMLEEAGYI